MIEGEMTKTGKQPVPVRLILDRLQETYPNAHCELHFTTPFELLVATILSAQTTDQKVNEVTKDLFPEYGTPERLLTLSEEELSEKIKTIGLYKNKSRNLLRTARIILERHGGEVPRTMEELLLLPGVGRKTANVVLSNAFGVPAIAVDTHVFRVSNRIGLANSEDVLETEKQLMDLIPRSEWSFAHHLLIWHGRRICHARAPRCMECPIFPYCRFASQSDAVPKKNDKK